jgi:hypothetical protein
MMICVTFQFQLFPSIIDAANSFEPTRWEESHVLLFVLIDHSGSVNIETNIGQKSANIAGFQSGEDERYGRSRLA